MRKTALTVLTAAALLLPGCVNSPRPAKTELEGGESRLISERLDRRPVESRMVIKAEMAPAPPPPAPPMYIIRITPEKKPQE